MQLAIRDGTTSLMAKAKLVKSEALVTKTARIAAKTGFATAGGILQFNHLNLDIHETASKMAPCGSVVIFR